MLLDGKHCIVLCKYKLSFIIYASYICIYLHYILYYMRKELKYIELKIREITKKKGWSIKFLCENIGVSQTGLTYIFKEESLKISLLYRIADFLEVDIQEFFNQDPTLSNIDESVNQAGKNNTQTVKSVVTGDTQYMAKIMKLKTENKYQKEMIEKLEEQIKDKEEIIALLKGKK